MRLPALLLITLLGFLFTAVDARAGETVTVGGAVVPIAEGWTQKVTDNGLVLTPPSLPPGVVCSFTLLGGEVFEGSVKDRLATEWKGFEAVGRMVTDNGTVIDGAGRPVEIASRSGMVETDRKVTIHIWLVIARTNGRVEKSVFVPTTQEAFAKYIPAVSTMINGTKYVLPKPADPAPAAPKPDAPLAADDTAARENAARLDKAREQFANDLARRRKPHTILGDILGLDGKPIPNVATYRVTVWGTTIAAEKTRYGFDVDVNGHFEQQVPDGLYQIDAACIVDYAGHRVPVQLVWLDAKKVGVDQASAAEIVRDFRMVVSGLKPGEDPAGKNSYFGGLFSVAGPSYDLARGNFSTRHPGAKVRLTLTARGPLIDGSQSKPFAVDIDVTKLNSTYIPPPLPIGVYQVTAILIEKDGAKTPLQISRIVGGQYGDSVDIFWEAYGDNKESRADPAVYLKD